MRVPKAMWLIKLPHSTYLKSDPGVGFPYRSFRTRLAAMKWLETWPKPGAKPIRVKVRISED